MNDLSLLLIEDNPGDARLFQEMLTDLRIGYQITWVQSLAEALKEIAQKKYYLILSDLGLPDSQGLETAYSIIATASDTPIIILTGQHDDQIALEAIKTGVQDYLLKNTVTTELLGRAIRYAVERKRAEKELRSRENLFNKVFEILPVGLWITDKTGKLIRVNRAGVKIWGEERLVGQPDYGVYKAVRLPSREEIKPDDWALAHTINKGMTILEEELEIDAFDGQKKSILNYTAPVLDDNGKLEAALVVNVDITQRKRADAERERLMTAIDQMGETVCITDPAGMIQYVNPVFETVTGYTREEVMGQNMRILKSGKQDAAFYRDLYETIFGGRTWKGRMVNKKKDGTFYTEEATISPVCDAAGRVLNFVAVKRDITEHLHLMAQFQQAQKLESVGRLAGGVAHDYNNMVSVILGFTELAMGKVDPAQPIHDDLTEVLNAAIRTREITRQLLAFARSQTIAPEVLDLNDVIGGMLKMLRRLIGEDIDLAWLPSSGLWSVKMDPTQIDQILANLCVNARDAISDVGKVTIETHNITFDADYCAHHAEFLPGEYVLMAISDGGCGMDTATLDQIFEPFFTTKGRGKGTGLGLSTVYGIVKQNKGFINVYSEPGKGTTFRIYLPRHVGRALEARVKNENGIPPGRGELVLLVEDEPSILKMSRRMLESLGYTVLAASAPDEAIRLAVRHEGEIHVLMTDVVMPGMNGRDLSERIREIRPTIKCLFMSGYTANVIAHRGVLDEGVQFIQKPFSKNDLSVKFREILDDTSG